MPLTTGSRTDTARRHVLNSEAVSKVRKECKFLLAHRLASLAEGPDQPWRPEPRPRSPMLMLQLSLRGKGSNLTRIKKENYDHRAEVVYIKG